MYRCLHRILRKQLLHGLFRLLLRWMFQHLLGRMLFDLHWRMRWKCH